MTLSSSIRNKLTLPGYTVASMFVSLGGFLNGYDTGSIGPVTEMPPFLHTFGELSPTLRGFTVSIIMLAGALPSLFAGQLADRLGRLRIIIAGALIFTIGAVMQAAAFHLPMFIVGRGLCGIGEGLWISNVSVYVTEIAPSARRGMLGSAPQLLVVTGLCAGYFTCYGSVKMQGDMSWRLPFVVMAIIAALLATSCFFIPESPRWLILHGRRDKALHNIERLNFSRVEAEKDILRPAEQAKQDVSLIQGLRMIFTRQYRSQTILALFVLGSTQLSGIDAVLFYAPTLMTQAGLPSQTSAFLASGVSAILMVPLTVIALLTVDRWGRRVSTLTGGSILAACMLIIGSLYAAKSVHPDGFARWIVVVLIFTFALTYSFTWAVVSKIYASEIQPAHTRATASCIAQGLNFFTNWIVAFFAPIFLAKSAFGAYFLFGALSLANVLVLAAIMPETRGVSLENMQDAFRSRPIMKSWAHILRSTFSGSSSSSSSRDSALAALGALPGGPSPNSVEASDGIELANLEGSTMSTQVDLSGPAPLRTT